MYNKPPPQIALDWSIGLLFDVALRIGLGNEKAGNSFWTVPDLIRKKKLPLSHGQLRKWRHGNGIPESQLPRIVEALCSKERYQREWQYVFEISSVLVLNNNEMKTERKNIFGVKMFASRGDWSRGLIVAKLDEFEPLVFDEPEPIQPSNQEPTEDVSSSWIDGLKLRDIVFTDICFCTDEDFDQTENRCLKSQAVFPYGTKLIHMSFCSDVLKQDAQFKLRWYRNRAFEWETEKTWSETFAKNLNQAATFYGNGKDNFKPGSYQVQFVADDQIIGEAAFSVSEREI